MSTELTEEMEVLCEKDNAYIEVNLSKSLLLSYLQQPNASMKEIIALLPIKSVIHKDTKNTVTSISSSPQEGGSANDDTLLGASAD